MTYLYPARRGPEWDVVPLSVVPSERITSDGYSIRGEYRYVKLTEVFSS
jgi:hypothetical protein